jgi:methionyl-tRNA formyltransferase
MTDQPWRVAIITSVAPIAHAFADAVRDAGHEPVAVLTPRRPHPMPADIGVWDATAPPGMDVLIARNKWSMEPLLRAVRPDLVLCFGFPWLIPPDALAVPRLGVVNMHPALLPRHRGPIPTSWAVRAGDETYGVTWHWMDAEFDTGNILAQAPVPMEPDDSDIRVVGPRLVRAAVELLPRVFERVAAGDPGDPQNVTGDEPYAAWFDEDYAEIDWSRPGGEVDRQVRAWSLIGGSRVPGPLTTIDGRRVLVKRASTIDPGDVDGAVRMQAGDGPIWILDWEPAEPADAVEGEPQP